VSAIEPSSEPPTRDRNAAGTAYLVDVALGVAIVLLLLELAASMARPRWHFPFDRFESAEEVLLRLRSIPPSQPYVLVMGDSVMVDGALRRAGVPDAKECSISVLLSRLLQQKAPDSSVVSLAMEGALSDDYAAILRLVEMHHRLPAAVMLQVDYRLLSPVNDSPALSRDWLRPYGGGGAGSSGTAGYQPAAKIVRPIDAFVREHLLFDSNLYLLLRGGRRLLRERVLGALTERSGVPPPEDDAVLRLLVARYYQSPLPLTEGRPVLVVERIIDHLLERNVPVLICFTPVNFEFLGDRINAPMYQFNVNEFRERLHARYQSDPRFRLAVFEDAVPTPLFLDHTHFNAAGNELLARMMAREFEMLWLHHQRRT
jgi:lysophospholipase L1-like esterase